MIVGGDDNHVFPCRSWGGSAAGYQECNAGAKHTFRSPAFFRKKTSTFPLRDISDTSSYDGAGSSILIHRLSLPGLTSANCVLRVETALDSPAAANAAGKSSPALGDSSDWDATRRGDINLVNLGFREFSVISTTRGDLSSASSIQLADLEVSAVVPVLVDDGLRTVTPSNERLFLGLRPMNNRLVSDSKAGVGAASFLTNCRNADVQHAKVLPGPPLWQPGLVLSHNDA